MDTKTTQRQLISLITEHLSESIPVTRILTYKPDKSGSVTGRFESLNRVYNFEFNGNDVRYKPAMNADSALFSKYYLERFDAAPATVKGTRALPKCTSKSYSCKGNVGVRCLPLNQNCKMGNTAIGNERLSKIKNLSKSLAGGNANLETTRAKIVEKRMALAVENRAKREPKKQPVVTLPVTTTTKPSKKIDFSQGQSLGAGISLSGADESRDPKKKKTYKNLDKAADKISQATGMSKDEARKAAHAVISYAMLDYSDIRENERKGKPFNGSGAEQTKPTFTEDKDYDRIKSINNFLDKAPKYEGTVHRGLKFSSQKDFDKFLGSIKSGEALDAMSSTTSNPEIAKGFATDSDAPIGVVMNIKNKSGVSIKTLSKFSNEDEVLVPKGALYKASKITKSKSDSGKDIYTIDVDEIDPENQQTRRDSKK